MQKVLAIDRPVHASAALVTRKPPLLYAAQDRAPFKLLRRQAGYDWVASARFKGSHITRHYGDPANDIDAVQL